MFKINGIALINKIKSARDPSNPQVAQCRIGLSNDDSVSNLIGNVAKYFSQAYISSSKRKKRGLIILKIKFPTIISI